MNINISRKIQEYFEQFRWFWLIIFESRQDWSLKYDQDNPVQPRYDLNAPDLYIPAMAYITFVVLAGLVMGMCLNEIFRFFTDFNLFLYLVAVVMHRFLGMQNKFTPEQLGMISSSALAFGILEIFVYFTALYMFNIKYVIKLLDLIALCGYKFVTINLCILVSIIFKSFGYYLTLLYTGCSLCFFLVCR